MAQVAIPSVKKSLSVSHGWKMLKNVLMVSCLKSIFYEFLISRQRSYRESRSAVFKVFLFTRFSWKYTKRDWEFVITILTYSFFSVGISRSLLGCLMSLNALQQLEICKWQIKVRHHKRNVYQQANHIVIAFQRQRENCFAIKSPDKKEISFSLCVDFPALSVLW